MKPLNENRAGHLLRRVVEAVFCHPRWFSGVELLLVLVCLGYTVSRLQFSTNKNDLISVQASYRRQFLQFKTEFNVHDNMIVLVESDDRERNREFVERLGARLQTDAQFGDVYYRSGLKRMGPKALLFLPEERLAELQQNLRTSQPLLQTFSQATNLDTLFGLVDRQFRLSDTQAAEKAGDAALPRSLQALQWVVEQASDFIESREVPLAPNITTLLSRRQHETGNELYLSFDHGRIYLLITRARDAGQEHAAIHQLRKRIAQTRSEVPGLNVGITGEEVLRHDEMEQARHDTEVAAFLALALTALLFICTCRKILRPLMACCCLLIGICYSLGFATLTVGRLNILSLTLVPMLIGLAIDYGVHLIFRYEEELRRGQGRPLAIGKAFGFTGIGVITNALTIAGAFYLFALTDFKGMREMGFLAGSGVILCLIPMLTLLPLLLVRGEADRPEPARGGKHRQQSALLLSLQTIVHEHRPTRGGSSRCARLGQVYLRHPWGVLVGGAVFTALALVGSFKVQFDYNLLNLQSRRLPAVRTQTELFRAGSQSLLYCAVVADSLPQAVEWERRIEQLPAVARVVSLVKYLTEDQERKLALIQEVRQELGALPVPALDPQPVNLASLNQTLFSLSGYLGLASDRLRAQGGNPAGEAQLAALRQSLNRLRRLTATYLPSIAARLTTFQQRLFGEVRETLALLERPDDRQRLKPQDVPPFLRNVFMSRSGKFLLQVYPRADVWQRDKQAEFIRELRTVDPQVTGSPVQFYEYTSRLKQSVEQAAACAAGVIALLVFLHFRGFASVLLALLPVTFGFCWMLGLMGWLGIPFNPVNIVSLILVIGIGVANGVHILNRFAEEAQPNILARSTGKAVLVSGLNTMAGFGSLLVARHQGIASLGEVMALGTGTCMVASLVLLPAVLTLLARAGWCPTHPAHPRA